MTATVLGVSVDAGAPALHVRAAPTPISAAGVNDAATLARQQLVNAVPAPAAIAAYSSNIVPQPKPPARPSAALPSSPLAAQFIAQDAAISGDELAIFTPRPTPAPAGEAPAVADDYLSALRTARGEVAPAKSNDAAATAPSQQAVKAGEQADIATAKITTYVATETLARTVVAQAATGLPSVFSQFIRKPSIINARGLSAYQLAQARNAAMRKDLVAS